MSEKTVEETRPDDPGRPLSEDEKSLLKRILAEPLEFPIEFRSWLKNFIETSGAILPRSSIAGIGGTGVRFDDFPPGVLLAWAGSSIPGATLPCNGAAVARDFYKDLFTAIGTTWGPGNGTTTFNVPDLRDRALYGAGAVVGLATTDGRASGNRGGPSHHHYFSKMTDNGGYHGHGMHIDGVGDHIHYTGGGTVQAINAADQIMALPNTSQTQAFPTTGAGGHSHSGGVDGGGEHQHPVNGDTSGSYDQDKPSFAGVQMVITTGRTA